MVEKCAGTRLRTGKTSEGSTKGRKHDDTIQRSVLIRDGILSRPRCCSTGFVCSTIEDKVLAWCRGRYADLMYFGKHVDRTAADRRATKQHDSEASYFSQRIGTTGCSESSLSASTRAEKGEMVRLMWIPASAGTAGRSVSGARCEPRGWVKGKKKTRQELPSD